MGLIFDDRALTQDEVAKLQESLKAHIRYVVFLLDFFKGWSEDGTFTFPNGDTFYKDDFSPND